MMSSPISSPRYARLQALPWWQQDRVQRAVALVAGCGALGNEVVKNLLLLGWGHVLLADFDRIELSNLTRSVFFRPEDVDRPKAQVLAERGAELNADCRLQALEGDLRLTLSTGLVSRVDVVFGCLDNVAARLALSSLAGTAGRLLIDGGMTPWEGTVSLFAGGAAPCYACGLTEQDHREMSLRRSCPAYAARARAAGAVPTTAPVASMVGAQMVQLGLKWLHGLREAPHLEVGTQVRFDTAFDRYWKVKLPCNPDCLLHPEAVQPVLSPALSWTHPWRRILSSWRRRRGQADAVLHLPWPVLESWTCPGCGTREVCRRIHLTENEVTCGRCLRTAIPRLTNQILGRESFTALSPQGMGFPPWTWITAVASDRESLFELAGGPADLQELLSSEPLKRETA
jgi:molybdopterin/thiamine biosynthesis adenylyltransferase